MNWLNQLQSLLGQKSGASTSSSSSEGQGLNKLLVPGALGGLAGLLVANKSSRKLLAKYGTGALLVGGGAVAGTVLWNKYKDRIRETHQDEPQFGQQQSPLDVRTERLILALVFAAKSDGHIDEQEQAAIESQLREAGIDIDHFMERSYLNALGDALKVPQDVREGIEQDLQQQKRALTS